MFERYELLVGDKFEEIQSKTVLVVGVGGVGGYAVETLVRAGIKNFIIVDSDRIDISNLNRQLLTTHDNIGEFKVDECEKRIKSINPDANVKKNYSFLTLSNINVPFEEHIDYVVDCCDTTTIKLELIRICKRKGIKMIQSMGTGNKLDPTRLRISDVRVSHTDPLARFIRKMVKDEKVEGDVMVVWSDEKYVTKMGEKIPTCSFVPATSGLLCASYIINDIIGTDIDYKYKL